MTQKKANYLSTVTRKNATQISKGKTEQQMSETTKRSTASEQAVDQQIKPETNQL